MEKESPVAETPREAAQNAVEPERLLPGEDPRTTHPDDVRHWMSVYAQLLSFKEKVLSDTHASMAVMEPEARAEVSRTDATVLEAERQRLRRRADFWEQRHRELTLVEARP